MVIRLAKDEWKKESAAIRIVTNRNRNTGELEWGNSSHTQKISSDVPVTGIVSLGSTSSRPLPIAESMERQLLGVLVPFHDTMLFPSERIITPSSIANCPDPERKMENPILKKNIPTFE